MSNNAFVLTITTTHLPKKLHLTHKSLKVNESQHNFGVLVIHYSTPQQLH